MRHRVAYRKLGRVTPHRTALLRNLATALFERERIQTTLMKAKELRPYAEKLITLATPPTDTKRSTRPAVSSATRRSRPYMATTKSSWRPSRPRARSSVS